MKSIILIAFVCATALALPSKPVEQKTNLIEIFKETIAPKLTSLQVHKISLTNKLYNLLEDNENPGLKDCVDQFIASTEEIYNLVQRAAGRLVTLFQKYNLNKVVQAELPQIVERVSLRAYEGLAEAVQYQHDLGASDEDVVGFFVVVGISASAVFMPFLTFVELYNVIGGVSVQAGDVFHSIMFDLCKDSSDQVYLFLKVLVYAILGLSV